MKTPLRLNVVGLVLLMLLGGLATRFLFHAPLALSIVVGIIAPVVLLVFLSGGLQLTRVVAGTDRPVTVCADDIRDLLFLVEVGEIRDPEGYIEDLAHRAGVE